MGNKGFERFIVLYIPWLLASVLQSDALLSYFIAWIGSFLIFGMTLTGWVKAIPGDRSFSEQLMRPLFIMQIIFAGYMSCSSIFYFINLLGYTDFHQTSLGTIDNREKLILAAQCQRYYCLGHAAFVTGILVCMNYPKKQKYYIERNTLANLLMRVAFVSYPVSLIFTKIPGLAQFYFQFSSLSFIAGTLALAFAIPLKKSLNTALCGLLYLFNLYSAFTSGFKEPIIVSVLVLGVFLYPNYKKLVLVTFGPILLLGFVFLPAYVSSFRGAAWADNADADESAQIALDATLNETNSNWSFLVYRLSEMDMFTTFVESTPKNVDYYGTQLLKQSAIAIVPRVFWPGKPMTEELIMERVYDAGVVNRLSNVSAKPAYIVDGYLSGGLIGIFLSLFAYGAIAQLISVKAEQLFGGYILGTALIFSGLFQSFWRGLAFEFLINSIFWSFISMFVIHKILVARKILKKV
jgi:uncharacterized membrane protein